MPSDSEIVEYNVEEPINMQRAPPDYRRSAFEQLTDEQVHDVVLLVDDSLPPEWSNFTPMDQAERGR